MSNDILTTIRARATAATNKAIKLRNQLDAALQEARDLETAIKVIEDLQGAVARGTQSGGQSSSGDGATMPELILLALEDGPKPISEVTATVADLSDKEVDANNIRSTAWRMWKADRIGKTGDLYHLIGQAPVDQKQEFDL
jgi:hypothetical protein